MKAAPILTRDAMLEALRTWERIAHDYLVRSELAADVAWYFDALEAAGVLPEMAPLQDHCHEAWTYALGQEPFASGRARRVYMQIAKSNLLARLLYCGESVRTRPCPIHLGHWSGCHPEPCPEGCGYTGWLPEATP